LAEILLTGGTGLIGPAVVMESLRKGDGHRWTLLVRAATEEQARARLVARWERFVGLERALAFAAECEVLCGDLLDIERNPDPRLDRVTHVLHLAADTSFRSKETNWRVNYEGTLALAARMSRAPRLERFLHCGTAMICGRDGAGRVVREDEFPQADSQHITEYTRSKAATELALAERFPDLPLVIARPSIVAGHTELGCEPTASIFWSVRLGDLLGLVSNDPEGGLDVVPFDWTSRALLFLLTKPTLRHQRYHLSTGSAGRSPWTRVAAAIAKAEGGRAPIEVATFDVWARGTVYRERFFRHFDRKDPVAVTMYMAQKKYYEFCALDVTFDNARLLAEGFAPPPALADYAGVCVTRPAGAAILDLFRDDLCLFEAPEKANATV
jgi:nucleoside-diphosphate-sugar epimerase